MKSICMICGLMAGLLASAAHAREWTDRSGKFHIEAGLVTVKEGKVYLEKEGGKVVAVPLEEMPWSAAFTLDGKHLLFGGNGKVNLWEVATGRKLYEFDTDAHAFVRSLAISPDGKDFSVISSNPGNDVVVYRLPPEAQSQVQTGDYSSGRN